MIDRRVPLAGKLCRIIFVVISLAALRILEKVGVETTFRRGICARKDESLYNPAALFLASICHALFPRFPGRMWHKICLAFCGVFANFYLSRNLQENKTEVEIATQRSAPWLSFIVRRSFRFIELYLFTWEKREKKRELELQLEAAGERKVATVVAFVHRYSWHESSINSLQVRNRNNTDIGNGIFNQQFFNHDLS